MLLSETSSVGRRGLGLGTALPDTGTLVSDAAGVELSNRIFIGNVFNEALVLLLVRVDELVDNGRCHLALDLFMRKVRGMRVKGRFRSDRVQWLLQGGLLRKNYSSVGKTIAIARRSDHSNLNPGLGEEPSETFATRSEILSTPSQD